MGYFLKERKSITINNAFEKSLDESTRKPSKTWVDKGSEFFNKSIKSWIEKITWKCIEPIIRENLLWLKDL